VPAQENATEDWKPDYTAFVLEPRVIDAVAGGPIVVDLTLRYVGSRPIDVVGPCDWNGLQVHADVPSTWVSRPPHGPILINGGFGTRTIQPNQEFKGTYFAHHDYTAIPPGYAELTFSWNILKEFNDNEDGAISHKVVATITTTKTIYVWDATPWRIDSLCTGLRYSRQQPHYDQEEEQLITSTLFNTDHPELDALAFELLQTRKRDWPANPMLSFPVYRWSRSSRDNHQDLLDYLYESGTQSDWPVFARWEDEGIVLTDAELKFLLRSPSLWTRALTYQFDPTRCPPGTKEVLLEQVQELCDVDERSSKRHKGSRETELGDLRKAITGAVPRKRRDIAIPRPQEIVAP
jgi:hypothetical protein